MASTSMPWIKLYTELLDDYKLARLTDQCKWRFVQLLLLAGECDAEGWLIAGDVPLTVKDIAWRLRIQNPDDLLPDLKELMNVGVVAEMEGVYLITKFAERQGRPYSDKRDQWAERQRRHREKLASVTNESRVTNASREEEEEDKDIDKEKESSSTAAKTRPTIFNLYEQEIGPLTKVIAESLLEAEKEYPAEWFGYAFAEAAQNNARSWKYVEAILKRWKRDGFKTVNKPAGGNGAGNNGNGKPRETEEEVFARKLQERRNGRA